jgi:hypothetical protein
VIVRDDTIELFPSVTITPGVTNDDCIVVTSIPDPYRLTLAGSVIPLFSVNVPGPTRITSPELAAVIAAEMVRKGLVAVPRKAVELFPLTKSTVRIFPPRIISGVGVGVGVAVALGVGVAVDVAVAVGVAVGVGVTVGDDQVRLALRSCVTPQIVIVREVGTFASSADCKSVCALNVPVILPQVPPPPDPGVNASKALFPAFLRTLCPALMDRLAGISPNGASAA